MANEEYNETVFEKHDYIRRIECFIALCCGSFIWFSYFRFKELRSPGFTLVFYMTLCDTFANLCLRKYNYTIYVY